MRKDFIKAGYLVAIADGEITESERSRMGVIAEAIKITPEQIREAIKEVKN